MSQTGTKRLSSLEAAGVKSVTPKASTTPKVPAKASSTRTAVRSSVFNSSTTNTTKSVTKPTTRPSSTTPTAAGAGTRTTTATKPTVKPIRTAKPTVSSNDSTPKRAIQTSIRRSSVVPSSPVKKVASSSSTASSRASTSNSSSTTKTSPTSSLTQKQQQKEEQKKPIRQTSIKGTVSPSSSMIQELKELKDKNATYEEDLKIKTNELEQLKQDLVTTQNKLQEMETEMMQESMALKGELQEKTQLFQKEKEEVEKKNRDTLEKLREKLELEKQVLTSQLDEKERQIQKLKVDLDDMRTEIQTMHQSHQTRLTTLTNQLNLQHNEAINELKLNYEKQENTSALELKIKELEDAAQEHIRVMQALEESTKEEADRVTQQHHDEITNLKLEQEKEIEKMQGLEKFSRENAIAEMEASYQKRYDDQVEKYNQTIEKMKQDHSAAMEEVAAAKLVLENEKNDLIEIHKSELEKKKIWFEDELQKAQEKHAFAIEELNKLHLEKIQGLENVNTEEVKNKLDDMMTQHELAIQTLEQAHKQALETESEKHESAIKILEQTHNQTLETEKVKQESALALLEQTHKQTLDAEKEKQNNLIKSHEKTVHALKGEVEARVNAEALRFKKDHQEELEQLERQFNYEHKNEIESLNETHLNEKKKLETEYERKYTALESKNEKLIKNYEQRLSKLEQSSKDAVSEKDSIQQQYNELLSAYKALEEKQLSTLANIDGNDAKYSELENKLQTTLEEHKTALKSTEEKYQNEITSLKEGFEVRMEACRADTRRLVEKELQVQIQELKSIENTLKTELLDTQKQIEKLANENQESISQIKRAHAEELALIEENERKQSKVILKEADREWQTHVDSVQISLSKEHAKSIQALHDKHNAVLQEAKANYTNTLEQLKATEANTEKLQSELKALKDQRDVSITGIKNSHLSQNDSLVKEIDALKKAVSDWELKYAEQAKQVMNLKMEIEEYESNDINNHAILINNSSQKDDGKFQDIVKQHQKELNILQQQFQNLLDMKDRELEELSYRLKTMNGNELKEAEKNQQELKARIAKLEQEAKSKELEMRWLESDSEQNETKLKQQDMIVHSLEDNNSRLERQVKRFKEENEQMLRLIHQLQSEIHPMNK